MACRAAPAVAASATREWIQRFAESALLLRLLEHLQRLVDGEASRFLARRVFPERPQKLADVLLRRHHQERVVEQIIPVCIGGDGGTLVRVGAQVGDHGNARLHEGFTPDLHGPLDPLLGEPELPVVVAQAQQVAVVREVKELLARALRQPGL